ncbi:TonB-dependent receptor [Pedobacter montanisoli]|uniref:TonB-dependent receptor n=1 Tax=Pedobacter montanisoli TaxID=2923277 RepID=A0ABT0A054_9SPHI|nr:TonB-dependent receptor [Pedobacter montanisoli]MCJ0743927.1 TonB-dependent receptor [Pedobacter montanisoli]
MTLNKNIYLALSFVLCATYYAKAQDVKPPEKTEKNISEEIEIIRPYKPILAEAVKLRRSPDLENVRTYKAKYNYLLLDKKLELNTDIKKLQAQQLADAKIEEPTNNYVKGGVGSLTTFLGEAYIAMGKDPALQAGAFFRHFSQQGSLNKQNESNQQLSAFGRSIGEKTTLSGRANYQRHGVYFYGIDDNKPTLNPDPQKQAFNFLELEGEAINKYTPDENALSYAAKVNAYFWNDKFSAKEKQLTLTGYLNKRIKGFNLGLAAGAEFGSSKDVKTDISNNLLRINPYIKLQAGGVKIVAGANIVQEFGFSSSLRFFPAVTADFTLIPDFLQVFGELKGDVNRNTLKNLTDENPFLNSNILLKNSVEKISFSAGIKGTGGPGFGYKARFYSKEIDNLPMFVNNFTDFNKFDVIYDFDKIKLLGLEGELSVQVSDNLKWTGKLNIEDYKAGKEHNVFYKPQLRLSSNLLFVFDKKLSFDAGVYLQDDSKAKVFTANPLNPDGSYPALPDDTKEQMVNIKGFVDLGVGATYKFNSKFSAFAKANNILNSNYSKYLYYRVNGFNIFGGLTYSFN